MQILNTLPENLNHPLIYYQGTFDPAHDGHLSALKSAMEKTKAIGAIIVVDDAENSYKPDRSPWEVRKQTAITTFGHLENVCISPVSKEETKESLKKSWVIALIGSDVWPLYFGGKKITFQGLCISLRNEERGSYPEVLDGKEIICVTPEIQGQSSSKIRQYLKSHPEIYENTLLPSKSVLSQLNSRTLSYILENKIYYQSKENRLRRVQEKIQDYVAKHIFKDQSFDFECLTNHSSSYAKLGGQSGDLTFLASCFGERIFIKGYVRSSHLENFKDESEGMDLLNALSLSYSKSLVPIWGHSETEYSHIGLPYLETLDLAKVFKSIQTSEDEEKFIHKCFCVGRALSELHQKRTHQIQQEEIKKELGILNNRMETYLKTFPLDKMEHFKSILDSSYEGFLQTPGVHTYVHGDANLSNFVVNESDGTVHFLDLERFAYKRNEKGEPLGFPAEDYYRFLEGISWLNEDQRIDSSITLKAQEAFKEGYETFPSSITPEAHRYFSNYWRIRNYQFDPKDPV